MTYLCTSPAIGLSDRHSTMKSVNKPNPNKNRGFLSE